MNRAIQPWLDRVVEVCRPDERVITVLLVGSHAAGTADAFSDIDIGLVTTDAAFDPVVADLGRIVAALGEPLFDEHFDDPSNRHVIYADGTCLEVMVWAQGTLSIEGPHRVLFDRIGAGERSPGVGERRGATADERPVPPEDIRRRIVWFWHDVEHLVTALGRGETWWAFGQLDELRRHGLELARIADGAEIEPGEAYWKVDRSIGPARLAVLESTVAPLDLERIRLAALDLVEVYRGLATELARRAGIEYPRALDQLVVAQLASPRDERRRPGGP